MNRKWILWLVFLVSIMSGSVTYAAESAGSQSDSGKYITISVDATDDNGDLQYAIDSVDPDAFGPSNIFVIDASVPHTIYVKDVAGNITEQIFPPIDVDENYEMNAGAEEQSDTTVINKAPAEDGTGTMYDMVITDGSANFSRVFYTLTTAEGEVFYLIIDQNGGAENVYLLNAVTVDELQALAQENGYSISENIHANSNNDTISYPWDENVGNTNADYENSSSDNSTNSKAKSSNRDTVIIIIVAVIGGLGYYFFKGRKKKKDEAMDEIDNAMDMDEFVSGNRKEDEEDEMDMPEDPEDDFFGIAENEEKEEEALYDLDPDELE